jgi:hypothetical protein
MEGVGSSLSQGNEPSVDEFLQREQEVLGPDAERFVTHTEPAQAHESDSGVSEAEFAGTNEQAPVESESSSSDEGESSAVVAWRDKRQAEIGKRAEDSARRQEEVKAKARREIDDFYETYNEKKEKLVQQTRADEKAFLESRQSAVAGGTTWERILRLADISDKASKAARSDKSRFRELLQALSKDPKAPTAVETRE